MTRQITDAEIAEWKAERNNGMTSAVGEYTPEEFWDLLDAYIELKADESAVPVAWAYTDQGGIRRLAFERNAFATDNAPLVHPPAQTAQVDGWIVGNSEGTRWRSWNAEGSMWVESREAATRYARREDAELVHAEDENAWRITPYTAEPAAQVEDWQRNCPDYPNCPNLGCPCEPVAKVYQCPRCATSMQVDPTAKPSTPVAQGDGVDNRRSLLPDNRGSGLYRKFKVTRTDGSHRAGGKHEGCEYFVLDVDHDKYAMPALAAYVESAANEYPQLASDLRGRYNLTTHPHSPDAADSGRVSKAMVDSACTAYRLLMDHEDGPCETAMIAALEAALAAQGQSAAHSGEVPDWWVDINESQPDRNKAAIYWHTSNHGGSPAIADEWRDEHHRNRASHWLPFAAPTPAKGES